MALILNIETSASLCSVCLAEDGKVIHEIRANEANQHAKILTLQIEQLFRETHKTLQQSDAIALSSGPGSYTGLRIGASVAKGLCYALDKPLIAVSTLQSLAFQMKNVELRQTKGCFFLPVIEARKGAFYCALYDETLAIIEPETYCKNADTIPFPVNIENTFTSFPSERLEILKINNTFGWTVAGINPTASNLASLSFERFSSRKFENITLFEPNYITGFGNHL
ncbi:MAG TPA: tRNA (adenosine(37)-N6)-threonylcarbamoyltransferase complex dimerization subunit type 1 TsaB [Chitinophagales bacterium]